MRKKLVILLPVALLFLFSGCSVWEDFTTYFNLYYNTSDAFDQAETAIQDAQKDPFSLTEMPLPGTAQTQINKVIEKCSKILQFDASSSFADDALLMIGKCFYYQKTYLKALRKFEELETTHPESSLLLESQLWHAKTDLQLRNNERGLNLLVAVKEEAIKKGKRSIATDASIEEIRYYLVQKDYEKVQVLCAALLSYSNDSSLKAKVAYELGDIYEKQDKIQEATDAYASVSDYSASYDLVFNAALKYAKMLIKLNQPEKALHRLGLLKREVKYREFYDQIDLTTALAYEKIGDPDRAFQILSTFDSLYASSPQIGNARFERASLYENRFHNYDSAIFYYQKALSSLATVEYLQKIKDRAAVFGKYSSLQINYNDAKKQYFYAQYPDEYVKDSINFAVESAKAKAKSAKDTTAKVVQVLERERTFEEVEGDDAMSQINRLLHDTAKVQKVAPKRPTLSADTLRLTLAKDCLDIGNMFLTDLSISDSAYYYYNRAATEYECSKYQPRVIFSLGSYYLTQNDSSHADSLFLLLYDNYKTDRIVNEAAAKLGKPKIDFEADSAKENFLAAESLYKASNFAESCQKFYEISRKYSSSPYASKSLMAAGKILEDKLRLPDSAAVVYDTLIRKYPSSQHALAIFPKINFYKEEKRKAKQAIEDSLNAIKKAALLADSLKMAKADSVAKSSKRPLAKAITDSTAVKSPSQASPPKDSLASKLPPPAPAPKDSLAKVLPKPAKDGIDDEVPNSKFRNKKKPDETPTPKEDEGLLDVPEQREFYQRVVMNGAAGNTILPGFAWKALT